MDSTHAVKVLREHNEWRRGNRLETWDCMPYSPAELGAAIDSVCAALSERDRMLWEAVEILNKSTTQLAIAASSFRGQDMTRKEVLADETSAIMREGLALLSAYDASKKSSPADRSHGNDGDEVMMFDEDASTTAGKEGA